jgi:23S rRNA pseudouridine2604 synthase
MRVNQFIASSGYGSRRRADVLIREQKVTVNGVVAGIGCMINEGDKVRVECRLIQAKDNDIYIMLNKPPGITCTTARNIDGNIIDYLNYPERIFPVGRLDKLSEGLILLTDDGSIVNELLREENNEEKGYIVTVDKEITAAFITSMAGGVEIYNPRKKAIITTKECTVIQLDEYRFKITLSQGLNRQIRRMCRRFQFTVTKLQRVRIKDLSLGELELGQWRYLTDEEVNALKK